MIYLPTLKPLLGNQDDIYTEINYDKRFTTLDDVTRDEEHIHDFYEIYINLSGDVSFLVEDHVYPIGRGDVIVTAPNEIHRCLYHSDCLHEHFCIWIREFSFVTDLLRRRFYKSNRLVLPESEKDAVIAACFSLHRARNGEDALSFSAAKSFFEILETLCASRPETDETQSLPQSFSRVIAYISQHYTESACTVTRICENFYISKSTLCRHFHRYFQTSPSDYIEAKRFSTAKKLLGAGQSVQSACFGSGFSDCSHFIMRFRKKFGVTPYKYQKEFLK